MKQPSDNIPLADTLPHPAPINPGPHPLNHVFDRVLTVLFLLALAIPMVGTLPHWDIQGNTENRVLAPFPSAPHSYRDVTKLTDSFFAWFKDHFGFRNALIHSYNNVRLASGFLTGNEQVVIGKDGWLFLSLRQNQSFLRERGFESFTPRELDQWQHMLETRTAYLKARNCAYIFVIPPDKHTIYPEYLPPNRLPWVPSRLDQLLERLRTTHSPAVVVDMRAAILAAKGPQLLYYKTDTHWNDFGARVGYLSIMDEVRKALPNYTFNIQPESDFTLVHIPHVAGDLVGLLGLQHQFEETRPMLIPRVPYLNNPATQQAPLDLTKPRLYMNHDSFTVSLYKFIGPQFDHPYFTTDMRLNPEVIRKIKPQLVITELVERFLHDSAPGDLPEIANTPLDNQRGSARK